MHACSGSYYCLFLMFTHRLSNNDNYCVYLRSIDWCGVAWLWTNEQAVCLCWRLLDFEAVDSSVWCACYETTISSLSICCNNTELGWTGDDRSAFKFMERYGVCPEHTGGMFVLIIIVCVWLLNEAIGRVWSIRSCEVNDNFALTLCQTVLRCNHGNVRSTL